jgi:Nif-specific regulatory protein
MDNFCNIDRLSRPFDLSRQVTTLHHISLALSNSLDLKQLLNTILQVLYQQADMQYGMLCLFDKKRNLLFIDTLYGIDDDTLKRVKHVHYRLNEGILGAVMSQRRAIALPRVSDDLRFLDRLNIYDYSLPFIAVPLSGPDGTPLGVLAAQPTLLNEEQLPARTRLLEMVANLLCQPLRLLGRMSLDSQSPSQSRNILRCEAYKAACSGKDDCENLVGQSQSMRRIFKIIHEVAKWDTTVLIRGESGTGKELVANAIHRHSPRHQKPFVKLNCAALPDSLLESELFGHEKGAYTGAIRQRKGRFELADGGTLFLDEIGESSMAFQAKLLRILQEGEMERVGGDSTIKVNVRVIAASNRDLEEEVRAGHFREDLYYRLNVMPIHLPPLRKRLDDIAALATFIIGKLSAKQGRELRISDGALRLLMSYNWPGNVRELENCLERASVMSKAGLIDHHIILSSHRGSASLTQRVPPKTAHLQCQDREDDDLMDGRQQLISALEKSGWVQVRAARLLGMTPRQVAYRIRILNINIPRL